MNRHHNWDSVYPYVPVLPGGTGAVPADTEVEEATWDHVLPAAPAVCRALARYRKLDSCLRLARSLLLAPDSSAPGDLFAVRIQWCCQRASVYCPVRKEIERLLKRITAGRITAGHSVLGAMNSFLLPPQGLCESGLVSPERFLPPEGIAAQAALGGLSAFEVVRTAPTHHPTSSNGAPVLRQSVRIRG